MGENAGVTVCTGFTGFIVYIDLMMLCQETFGHFTQVS